MAIDPTLTGLPEDTLIDGTELVELLGRDGRKAVPVSSLQGTGSGSGLAGLPAALANLGAQPIAQVATPAGQGGAPNPAVPYIWNRDTSFVMVGDRESVQEDINKAAYEGKALIGDPTQVIVANGERLWPANLNADWRGQRFAAAANYAGSVIRVVAPLGGTDIGFVRNFNIVNSLVPITDPAAQGTDPYVDITRNQDAITIGDGGNYLRKLNFDNFRIAGFRTAIRFNSTNVFIIGFGGFTIEKCWERAISVDAGANANSGERIEFVRGTFGNIANPNGTGTILYMHRDSSDFDVFMKSVSLDYSDYVAVMSRGQLELEGCHVEILSNNAPFDLYTIAGKRPTTLIMNGGQLFQGPIATNKWTGQPGPIPTGLPSLCRLTGGRHSVSLKPGMAGGYLTKRNTVPFETTDGLQALLLEWAPKQMDGGFTDSATGAGINPFGTGEAYGPVSEQNIFYAAASGDVRVGWTVGGNCTSDTTKTLPGEVGSRKITHSASAGSSNIQSFSTKPGDIHVVETWVHIEAYTQGRVTLRQQFYADAAMTVPVGKPVDLVCAGLQGVSPVSSPTATITIPDARFPKFGLFNPGTMVQGAFAVGMELAGLSGAGLTSRAYIHKDNGDGTFNVMLTQAAAVPAQTIIGFTKVPIKRPAPAGAAFVKYSEYATGFVGTAYFSRTVGTITSR